MIGFHASSSLLLNRTKLILRNTSCLTTAVTNNSLSTLLGNRSNNDDSNNHASVSVCGMSSTSMIVNNSVQKHYYHTSSSSSSGFLSPSAISPIIHSLHKQHSHNNYHSNEMNNIYGITVRTFMKRPVRSRRIVRPNKSIASKPTIEIASSMPLSIQEIDNNSLYTMGALGYHNARAEILKRHIMSIDKISYDDACIKYLEVKKKRDEYIFLASLPYKIGIFLALSSGALSIPLVFHEGFAHWFNANYVSADIPEPKDMETMLEIGSWTWNWMEPALGTASFVLLALQYSRAQIENLGYKPYTAALKRWKGERLARAYPQYDESILINFSESSDFVVGNNV